MQKLRLTFLLTAAIGALGLVTTISLLFPRSNLSPLPTPTPIPGSVLLLEANYSQRSLDDRLLSGGFTWVGDHEQWVHTTEMLEGGFVAKTLNPCGRPPWWVEGHGQTPVEAWAGLRKKLSRSPCRALEMDR